MEIKSEFLHELAAIAARQTLPRFRRPVPVSNKLAAGFDPVTQADREAELALRAAIRAKFPSHAILGEEYGLENPDSDHVWVIDPIDGTRAFISGLPTWGTLVGLTIGGDAVAGMMSQPFTGELYYASSNGAFYEGPDGNRDLAVRKTFLLADATLTTTTPALFTGEGRRRYDRLEQAVRFARYGTDCYAFAMLAAGNVDIAVDPAMQPYDIVALIPIIEKAGGVVTTFDGGPAEAGGDILAAATPELHRAAMEILNTVSAKV